MEKKTSIFLIILLCILVAVAGGSVSYYYLAGAHDDETQTLEEQIDKLDSDIAKLRKETKTTELTPTPTTTATTTTTTDPTANWKTYTNNNLKISFKYPQVWGTATYSTYEGDPGTNSQGFIINFSNAKIRAGGVNKGFTVSRGGAAYETNATIAYSNGNCIFGDNNSTTRTCQKFINSKNQPAYYFEVTTEDMFGKYIEGYIPLINTTFPMINIENTGRNTDSDQSVGLNEADKAAFKTLLTTFSYTN